ncbi:MAG: PQQ-dependent sugar dehydrogenase [Dehalococcoidia bacterium]
MTRHILGLCLVLLVSTAAVACGGGADTPAFPTADASPGPVLQPLPLGTPGNHSPSHLAVPDETIQFERGVLSWSEPSASIEQPTTLAFGPDGRLYLGQLDGKIVALTLDGRSVVAAETVAVGELLGDVLGIAFNPADPVDPVTLYVSHTTLYSGDQGAPYAGKVSKLVGPGFEPVDIVTGLPVSADEHGTNGIAFDADGRLYIAQGGTTNAGIPSDRHSRPETPLSSAVLIADLTEPSFDGVITYEPPNEASSEVAQIGGDVRVYAAGLRNAYDLVVHSNGWIYATDNGSNAADGKRSTGCGSDDAGPDGPDELNLVLEGRYYGHPNRNRGRADERQCFYRPSDDPAGPTTPPLATLGYFVSADGMAEYMADAFDGRMRGDLVYVEWAQGHVWRVVLGDDGTNVVSISQLLPDPLDRPIDVAVGPDGALYIAEMGTDSIVYFAPAGS